MFDLVDSFIATGLSLSGVQVPVPVVDVVEVAVETDVASEGVVAPDAVAVLAPPFVFVVAELACWGVVDFADFVAAPFVVVVLAVAEAPLTFVVEDFVAAPVEALSVEALGPCTFGVVGAPPRAASDMAGTPRSTKVIPTNPSHRVAVRMVNPPKPPWRRNCHARPLQNCQIVSSCNDRDFRGEFFCGNVWGGRRADGNSIGPNRFGRCYTLTRC
jgi:hypothetical protein